MPAPETADERIFTPAQVREMLTTGNSAEITRAIEAKNADGNNVIATNPTTSTREKVLNSIAGACLFLTAAIVLTSMVDAGTGKTISERFMDVFRNQGFSKAAAEGFHLGLLLMPIAAVGAAAANAAAYLRNKDKISLDNAGEILVERAKTLEGQSQGIAVATQEQIFEALAQVMQRADRGSQNPSQTMTKTLQALGANFLEAQIPNDTVKNLAAKFSTDTTRGEIMTSKQVRDVLQTSNTQTELLSALQAVNENGDRIVATEGRTSWDKTRAATIAATALPAALLLANSVVSAAASENLIKDIYIGTRIIGAPKVAFYPILAGVIGAVGAAAGVYNYKKDGGFVVSEDAAKVLQSRLDNEQLTPEVVQPLLAQLLERSNADGKNSSSLSAPFTDAVTNLLVVMEGGENIQPNVTQAVILTTGHEPSRGDIATVEGERENTPGSSVTSAEAFQSVTQAQVRGI